jgi:energy-coupling factor transport system permease protein
MRFSSFHPLINLLFFTCVIVFAVLCTHPAYLAAGALCALVSALLLGGRRAAKFSLGAFSAGVLWTAGYALTMHFGETVIGYTSIGNAVTAEALACGAVQGMRIAIVLVWVWCLLQVFTADKVTFLLGRFSPRFAAAVSYVLRALPVLNAKRRALAVAQCGIGSGPGQGGPIARLRQGARRLDMLASWGAERGFWASLSARSRGSALSGRIAYPLYRFDLRDRSLVIVLVLLATAVGAGIALDQAAMWFVPAISMTPWSAASTFFLVAYVLFGLLPAIMRGIGQWRFSHML